MRVLIIPSWYPIGEDKLMGIYHKEYARALKENGVDTDILYVFRQALKHPIKYMFMKKYEIDEEDGYKVYRIKMLNLEPISLKLHMYVYQRKLDKLYKKYINVNTKPDVIHAQVTLPAGYASVKLSKKYDIPLVVTEHSSNFKKYFTDKNKPYGVSVVKNSKFTVVSNLMKEQAKTITKDVEVIPNVIDTKAFNNDIIKERTKDIRLLLVSAFRIGKGIETILNAVDELVNKRHLSVKLTIVGDGYLMDYYKQIRDDLHLQKSAHFVGKKEKSEIAKLLTETDIFIVSSNYESFCIPGIEAMASGTPIVSTRCGGPEEYIDENVGLLCNVKDPIDMANKIQELYNNIDKYDRNIIKKKAEKYSYKEVSNTAKKIYKKMIK